MKHSIPVTGGAGAADNGLGVQMTHRPGAAKGLRLHSSLGDLTPAEFAAQIARAHLGAPVDQPNPSLAVETISPKPSQLTRDSHFNPPAMGGRLDIQRPTSMRLAGTELLADTGLPQLQIKPPTGSMDLEWVQDGAWRGHGECQVGRAGGENVNQAASDYAEFSMQAVATEL